MEEETSVAEAPKWKEARIAEAPNGGSAFSGSFKMEEARVAEASK